MALVVAGVFIGADKDNAAGHGGRAVTNVAALTQVIRDIRDPADAVLFARGAGIKRMQLAIAPASYFALCTVWVIMFALTRAVVRIGLAPRPDDEHVVPGGAGPPVIVVAVHLALVGESTPLRCWRELPAMAAGTWAAWAASIA